MRSCYAPWSVSPPTIESHDAGNLRTNFHAYSYVDDNSTICLLFSGRWGHQPRCRSERHLGFQYFKKTISALIL